ncbi:MAG: hypothetical protein JNM56_04720 [Planctomycetia bacterium]|nr:hypothetical protein [Planctomycetia bacterium]
MAAETFTVVKVGGSLFDLPQLGPALRRWLDQLDTRRVVLLPGGGRAADAVRAFDQAQQLGEEAAHWLALRAMGFNVALLHAVLPASASAENLTECESLWQRGLTPILDILPFALADENAPGHLPHTWQVTSDALAARVAVVWGASRVLLLKSTALPASPDWDEAARRDLVDACFAGVVYAGKLHAEVIDFRAWTRDAEKSNS